MSTTDTPVNDKPYRIQTTAGHRKYLCSGLYMPSVTTVLSGTESEKSKAGLRNWNINNPGKLEEAGKRGTAIHHGCENYLRGLDPGVPDEYQDFWKGLSLLTLTGLRSCIGASVHSVRIGITSALTIRKLLMSGLLNISMQVVLT